MSDSIVSFFLALAQDSGNGIWRYEAGASAGKALTAFQALPAPGRAFLEFCMREEDEGCYGGVFAPGVVPGWEVTNWHLFSARRAWSGGLLPGGEDLFPVPIEVFEEAFEGSEAPPGSKGCLNLWGEWFLVVVYDLQEKGKLHVRIRL